MNGKVVEYDNGFFKVETNSDIMYLQILYLRPGQFDRYPEVDDTGQLEYVTDGKSGLHYFRHDNAATS